MSERSCHSEFANLESHEPTDIVGVTNAPCGSQPVICKIDEVFASHLGQPSRRRLAIGFPALLFLVLFFRLQGARAHPTDLVVCGVRGLRFNRCEP